MKFASVTFIAALAASGAAFAASPFVGTWTSDPAKSTFTGDTVTYTKTATGYHIVNGPVAYDFAVDGKPYGIFANRTATWTKTPDGWDIVFAAGGKTLTKAHRVLSPDGSTFTTSLEEYRGDGTVVHETEVYTRVGAGSDLDGTWKSTKADYQPDRLVIAPADGGAVRIEYPTDKFVVVTKLDDSPAEVSAPSMPPGAKAVYRKDGERKWTYRQSVGEKLMNEGVMTVSADGATLTDVSWAPGKEAEKTTEVYVRQ